LRHIALALALTLGAPPALAEIGQRPLRCEVVTEATGCQLATNLWNFTPSGGMVILGDTLRLAGTERISTGPDRVVILDLSLITGEVTGKTVLDRAEEAFFATTFSPDGQVLLAALKPSEAEVAALAAAETDDPGETTIRVFDAKGAGLGEAKGYVPTAMLAAFGENRLVFGQEGVSLDLNHFRSDDPPAIVSLRYTDGQIGGVDLIPDGQWLYDHLFDRDSIWRQGDLQVAAVRSGDGRPAAVWLSERNRDGDRVIVRDANEADDRFYDLEFTSPVLSPDGRHLVVLQFSGVAPAPILLAFDLQTEAGPVWKAAAYLPTTKDLRQSRTLWTEDGRLVVLHMSTRSDDSALVVFSPLP
jgi:hypothetical protein